MIEFPLFSDYVTNKINYTLINPQYIVKVMPHERYRVDTNIPVTLITVVGGETVVIDMLYEDVKKALLPEDKETSIPITKTSIQGQINNPQ